MGSKNLKAKKKRKAFLSLYNRCHEYLNIHRAGRPQSTKKGKKGYKRNNKHRNKYNVFE